jgi:hypothetical protein
MLKSSVAQSNKPITLALNVFVKIIDSDSKGVEVKSH